MLRPPMSMLRALPVRPLRTLKLLALIALRALLPLLTLRMLTLPSLLMLRDKNDMLGASVVVDMMLPLCSSGMGMDG